MTNGIKVLQIRDLIKPERDVMAKGLSFAICPPQLPVVDLITGNKSAIRNNNMAEAEAEQLQMKITLLKLFSPTLYQRKGT